MPDQREKTELFTSLKQILKDRKISYKKLAEMTGMAESTVKRIFSIEDCSLSKIMELAGAIDLSLHDLMVFSENRRVSSSTFSLSAEIFLAKNIDYFFFYRKIFHYKTVSKLLKNENTTKTQVTKFLKKLDDLKIIEWQQEDKIIFLHPSFLKFREDGPLRAAIYKAWIPDFTGKVLTNMNEKDHFIKAISARATQESIQTFNEQYLELIDNFLKKASFDLKTQPQNVGPIGISTAMGPYRIGLH